MLTFVVVETADDYVPKRDYNDIRDSVKSITDKFSFLDSVVYVLEPDNLRLVEFKEEMKR